VTTAAEREAYRQRLEVFFASRDTGQSLTLDALRAGIRLEAVTASAADVATYADEALAIVQEEYRPRLACGEGCSFCCRKPGVLATIPEFLRILDRVHTTFDAASRHALAERARAYVARLAGRHFDDLIDDSIPCPLLVDDRCSVYDVRPLVCRGYNSTDVEMCRRALGDRTALVPIFAVLKDVTDGATVGAAQGLAAAGASGALVDVGTALNIALSSGEGFASVIVNNGEPLRPAENNSWVSDLWALVSATAAHLKAGEEPVS
jgi:Fe-S-cluster containining protein